jgi:hypothetical protein
MNNKQILITDKIYAIFDSYVSVTNATVDWHYSNLERDYIDFMCGRLASGRVVDLYSQTKTNSYKSI